MTSLLKRGTAVAGLTLCAVFGASLAGCNKGGSGAAGSGETLATVGDAKISRTDLTSFLEAQQGETALPYLIDTQLVFEEAKKKGLEVTDAEVDADLARRQEADPSVKALIDAGGAKLIAAKNQVKRDLAIQKLLTADVKVTDAALKTFFTKYAKYYDVPAKAKIGFLISSQKARADLLSRQLASKSKTFAQLVEEQKKAEDPAAKQSTTDRGVFEALNNFPPSVATQLEKLPKGGSTKVEQLNVGLPTPVFAIFNKVDFQPAKKADLANMKSEIETDFKLAEVAKKAVALNPGNPPFDETLSRTQQFMQSQNPAGGVPRFRDVLNYINQTPANALLSSLRTNGTVQVDDPTYAKVAQGYQAIPAAGAPAAGGTPGAASNTASAPAANAAPAKQ